MLFRHRTTCPTTLALVPVLVIPLVALLTAGSCVENGAGVKEGEETPGAPAASAKGVVETSEGDLGIHPIEHATFVMSWGDRTIYVDPVGGKERFESMEPPDVILITDIHGDHLQPDTVKAVRTEGTVIVAPEAVAKELEAAGVAGDMVKTLANGESAEVEGIGVKAVPMYNLTEERKNFHPKGRGNGYVLDLAGTRVYISGDTEDIPEMRALEDIDVAFVCMNLPYTMTAESAADAVLEFEPAIVYPYHYRGKDGGTQDPEEFARLVREGSDDIEVRIGDWYGSGGR